jgi:Cyclin-dependent kinase regulatory subunit
MSYRLSTGVKVGEKYSDGEYEFRNVVLTNQLSDYYKEHFSRRLLSESDLPKIGIINCKDLAGFEQYGVFLVEPQCLMFRKRLRKETTKLVVDANSKVITKTLRT